MPESFDNKEHSNQLDASLRAELDALKTSLEKDERVSEELRSLYTSLVEQIVESVEKPKTLSLKGVAALQQDLEYLKKLGLEQLDTYLQSLEKKVQDIDTEKFKELVEDEKRNYLMQLEPGSRREALIRAFAQEQKERVAQQVEEEIQGPVASRYDKIGLGRVVRSLGEKAA